MPIYADSIRFEEETPRAYKAVVVKTITAFVMKYMYKHKKIWFQGILYINRLLSYRMQVKVWSG